MYPIGSYNGAPMGGGYPGFPGVMPGIGGYPGQGFPQSPYFGGYGYMPPGVGNFVNPIVYEQSNGRHFIDRAELNGQLEYELIGTAGGVVGGFLAGATAGGIATSWSGPGMLIGATVGGIVGAIGGFIGGRTLGGKYGRYEALEADARDDYRINASVAGYGGVQPTMGGVRYYT